VITDLHDATQAVREYRRAQHILSLAVFAACAPLIDDWQALNDIT